MRASKPRLIRPCPKNPGHKGVCNFCCVWEEEKVSEARNYTLLQGLLRSGVKVAEIVEKYKLHISRSKRHPNLIQFKYDQIESDLSDTLVQ